MMMQNKIPKTPKISKTVGSTDLANPIRIGSGAGDEEIELANPILIEISISQTLRTSRKQTDLVLPT